MDSTMKRLALTVAAAAIAWLGTTTESSAHFSCGSSSSIYLSTYTRCGCPVYVQRYLAYYDHCGRPVWQTRVLPVNHHCRSRYERQDCHGGGYRDRGYGGASYSNSCTSRGQWGNVVFQARW
jgi:hypothetical protein